MLRYDYRCKKNDSVYTVESPTAELVNAQDQYAWRRGVHEYLDNYTASCGHPDARSRTDKTKKADNAFPGTVAEWHIEIDRLLTEAVARFQSGDVPGTREPTDPEVIKVRALAALSRTTGVPIETLTKFLAKQEASGRAA